MAIDKSQRNQSALLVIDVQVNVVADAFKRDEKISNMVFAVEKARKASIPVVWVRHSAEDLPLKSDGWQIVPELKPLSNEQIVEKLYGSSFEATNLEALLEQLKVGHLYICGAQTNNCVRHTSHAAFERGYDVTLIADAHTTSGFEWNGYVVDAASTIDEQNTNFMRYELPGRIAQSKNVREIWE
jgi:nicotinamidase-related amidase